MSILFTLCPPLCSHSSTLTLQFSIYCVPQPCCWCDLSPPLPHVHFIMLSQSPFCAPSHPQAFNTVYDEKKLNVVKCRTHHKCGWREMRADEMSNFVLKTRKKSWRYNIAANGNRRYHYLRNEASCLNFVCGNNPGISTDNLSQTWYITMTSYSFLWRHH